MDNQYQAPVVDYSFVSATVRGVKLPGGNRIEFVVAGRVAAEVSVDRIKKVLWKLQNS